MSSHLYSSLPLLLLACSGDLPPEADCDLSGPHTVAAVTDFRVGALAAFTEDGCVADRLSSTSADAVVRATEERVWVINRTGGDALLAYPHGDYQTPELELGDYRFDNPHDLARVGDQLFLTLFDRPELVVLDAADGRELGRIDLGVEADADGIPEADALVVREGKLFVGLQLLDRDTPDLQPSGPGKVLRVDPASWVVEERWRTDVNPKLTTFDEDIVVMSGAYFVPDGGIEVIHSSGDVSRVVDESEVGLDFGGGHGGVATGTGFEVGGESALGCLIDGVWVEAERSLSWYADVRADAVGVVVAARPGFAGEGRGGYLRVDPSTCAVVDLDIATELPPFSLASVPGGR